METYSSLTGDLFGEPLTSSQADSLANHSQQPESERAEPMNDISFRKCFELFERSDRYGSSLKTFAASLVSRMDRYSPKLSHHWKAKVTRSLRFVFLLQPSKPRTGETGSGLLLTTPQASDLGRKTRYQQGGTALSAQIQMLSTPNASDLSDTPHLRPSRIATGRTTDYLSRQVAMLPTPTTQEVEHPDADLTPNGGRLAENGNSHSLNLADTVKMLPTPQFDDAKNPGHNKSRRRTLASTVYLPTPSANFDGGKAGTTPEYFEKRKAKGKQDSLSGEIMLAMLPTPRGCDAEGGAITDGQTDGHSFYRENKQGVRWGIKTKDAIETLNQVGTNPGLKLQPAFVEWMMGYPIGYTDLKHSEIA